MNPSYPTPNTPEPKSRVLVEMRPALDGFAGIPQETRLLFRGLCLSDSIELEGLLQTSHRFLAAGTADPAHETLDRMQAPRYHRYARVIISLETPPSTQGIDGIIRYLKNKRLTLFMALSAIWWPHKRKIKLTRFVSSHFEDYFWRYLFAKTLPAADFPLVTSRNYRVCTVPWNIMQSAGLDSLKLVKRPVYSVLDTQGFDFFIAQTPYPARVDKETILIVRYHDAYPVFMPHTIAHKSRHEATHYYALMSNVESGAHFACVSESSRQDLLLLFPNLGDRAVTIHNMVSHHFHDAASPVSIVRQIIRTRLNQTQAGAFPEFSNLDEQDRFYQLHLASEGFTYLLVVSTIEPRKNHRLLIEAWAQIRAINNPALKLVVVGNFGWDFESLAREMRAWIDQGAMFVLNNVPSDELRQLYQHAAVTVCPSLAEGFDFSGVEAMRSGGLVIASDIAVHREIYADAAEYFNPYCAESLVAAINQVLFEPTAKFVQQKLREKAKVVSARYLPEQILPRWNQFFHAIKNRRDNPA